MRLALPPAHLSPYRKHPGQSQSETDRLAASKGRAHLEHLEKLYGLGLDAFGCGKDCVVTCRHKGFENLPARHPGRSWWNSILPTRLQAVRMGIVPAWLVKFSRHILSPGAAANGLGLLQRLGEGQVILRLGDFLTSLGS